jgi:ankyrin repeat protein
MTPRQIVILLFAATVLVPLRPVVAQSDTPSVPSLPLWSTAPGAFSGYYSNVARAAAANDAARVQLLLADGASPNDIDDRGRTGLHIAAMNGDLQIMAILIKAGAKPDLEDQLGDTPLILAVDHDQGEAVRLLIEAGAQVNAQNRDGLTPLMVAARQGNLEMVRLLLAKGASVDKTDFTGRDALGWAHNQAVAAALKRAGAEKGD